MTKTICLSSKQRAVNQDCGLNIIHQKSLPAILPPPARCNHHPVFHISAELSAVIKATDSSPPHPSPPAEEESERSAYRALPGLSHSTVLLRSNAFLMHASREKAASANMHLSAHFHRAFMVKVLCETAFCAGTPLPCEHLFRVRFCRERVFSSTVPFRKARELEF